METYDVIVNQPVVIDNVRNNTVKKRILTVILSHRDLGLSKRVLRAIRFRNVDSQISECSRNNTCN
jgi:hypothetical protein